MTVDIDVSSSLSLQLTSAPFSLVSVGLIEIEYTGGTIDSIEKVNVTLLPWKCDVPLVAESGRETMVSFCFVTVHSATLPDIVHSSVISAPLHTDAIPAGYNITEPTNKTYN